MGDLGITKLNICKENFAKSERQNMRVDDPGQTTDIDLTDPRPFGKEVGCNREGMPGVRQPQSLTITVDGCAIDRQEAFTTIYAALNRLPDVNAVDFEIRDGKHIFYTRPWAVND